MVTINNLYETVFTNMPRECFYKDIIIFGVDLIDFNGNSVTRSNVVITCDKGKFSNNQQSITLNSDALLQIEYTATEWGMVTFKCNNTTCQMYVKGNGIKKINLSQGENPRYLYVDESRRKCMFSYYLASQTISTTYSFINLDTGAIPSKYRPSTHIYVPLYRSDIIMALTTGGDVKIKTSTSNATPDATYVRFEWTY